MSKWLIVGQIVNQQQRVIPNLKVFLVKETAKNETSIAKSKTDINGNYEIALTEKELNTTSKIAFRVFLDVYLTNGKRLIRSEFKGKFASRTVWNLIVNLEKECIDNNKNTLEGLIDDWDNQSLTTTVIKGVKLKVPVEKINKKSLVDKLQEKGIFNREGLVSFALNEDDIKVQAESLDLTPSNWLSLLSTFINELPDKNIEILKKEWLEDYSLGNLDPKTLPDGLLKDKILKIPKVDEKSTVKWSKNINMLYPFAGITNARDLRPYLDEARSQGGIGACTAFCATAIVEALENQRDTNRKKINLSEANIFWKAKKGQLQASGGYWSTGALGIYNELGGCEEIYHPYSESLVSTNYINLPVTDETISRGGIYKAGKVIGLPVGNVQSVKNVLETGRSVGISSNVDGWGAQTGVIPMPTNPNAIQAGYAHCTAIIGYIDKNDLPSNMGGGFFIVRNSWGNNNADTHILGPEYGGHLLMPYNWYNLYVPEAFTISPKTNLFKKKKWLVEYYNNSNLEGKPIENVKIGNADFEVPEEVDEVNYDWGRSSVFRYSFPSLNIFASNSTKLLSPVDFFSIRFSQNRVFSEGYHRFSLEGTDGMRLYVDDELVINTWKTAGVRKQIAEHYLTAGEHIVRVEYFDKIGSAKLKLNIEPMKIRYSLYPNENLRGTPVAVEQHTKMDLEWRHMPPVVNLSNLGVFSLKGDAYRYFEEGIYEFQALHSGGCIIRVDNDIVFNNWSGITSSNLPVQIAEGIHKVVVEFKQMDIVPDWDAKKYYKAFLNYGWSKVDWRADFYDDTTKRLQIIEAGYPNADSRYQAHRVHTLKGDPIVTTDIQELGMNHDNIKFSTSLGRHITGRPAGIDHISAQIKRNFFIPKDGYYDLEINCDEAFRFCIDGKQWIENHFASEGSPEQQQIWLKAGFHKAVVEYANTSWSSKIDFSISRSAWSVDYFGGSNFERLRGRSIVNSINDIIRERPFDKENFSVKAKRTIIKPLGTYLFHLKGDDGVRLKVNSKTIIDGWNIQDRTSYTGTYEHHGGPMEIELTYFEAAEYRRNKYIEPTLEFEMVSTGFFVEYYNDIHLENAPKTQNTPVAYRFEPSVNLDWGTGNLIPSLQGDNFSVRWQGQVDLPVGRYSIEVDTDSGVRLFIDGRMIISELNAVLPKVHKKRIDLVGRYHNVKLEYIHRTGNAFCKLNFVRELD